MIDNRVSAFGAEEPRPRIASHIAVTIHDRLACPIATGAGDRPAHVIGAVGLPAWLDHVLAAIGIRNRRADDHTAKNAEANSRPDTKTSVPSILSIRAGRARGECAGNQRSPHYSSQSLPHRSLLDGRSVRVTRGTTP